MRIVQLSGSSQHGWTLLKYAYVPVDPKVILDGSEMGKKKMGEIILGAVKQAGITTATGCQPAQYPTLPLHWRADWGFTVSQKQT